MRENYWSVGWVGVGACVELVWLEYTCVFVCAGAWFGVVATWANTVATVAFLAPGVLGSAMCAWVGVVVYGCADACWLLYGVLTTSACLAIICL
jgi:hypothetical protein